MAIEFRCSQCENLLRTGDDTVGRQAKCPVCGTITTIPGGGAALGSEPLVDSGNPYQSPREFADTSEVRPHGPISPTVVDFGDVFGRTWAIFKDHWTACLPAWLIVLVLSGVVNYAFSFAGLIVGRIVFGPRGDGIYANLGSVAGQFVSLWLGIGLAIFFLKIARGQAANFRDLFSGGPYYVNILLATLLFMATFYVGLLLCIVPGAIFALMFSQYYYLVLDRRLSVIDAFRQSKELTDGNKLTLFVIWLAMCGLSLLALIPCGLGILVAGPYFSLLFPVVYLAITGQPTADQMRASPAI